MPTTLPEMEEEQGDNLEKQGGAHTEVPEIFCGRSIESQSGGIGFNGLESNGTHSHSLEPKDRSSRNSKSRDRSKDSSDR